MMTILLTLEAPIDQKNGTQAYYCLLVQKNWGARIKYLSFYQAYVLATQSIAILSVMAPKALWGRPRGLALPSCYHLNSGPR